VFYWRALFTAGWGKIMTRLFFLLSAFLATALPQAAWAGSGGPSAGSTTWIVMALLVIIIILLALILKKLK
jgi:hypothetical protein